MSRPYASLRDNTKANRERIRGVSVHRSPTRYLSVDGVHLAYKVVGDGPVDIVRVVGWAWHVEAEWDDPNIARFHDRLANHARLILYDKRGTGLSDRVDPGTVTLERWADDVIALMDEVGSKQAVLLGESEGGQVSVATAVRHPDRVKGVALVGTPPRMSQAPDWPHGHDEATLEWFFQAVLEQWGDPASPIYKTFSDSADPATAERAARMARLSVSPAGAVALARTMSAYDIRPLVPQVQCPAVVIHRRDDPVALVGGARWLAEHIPNATYVELSGADHNTYTGDSGPILDAIEAFLAEATTAQPGTAVLAVLAAASGVVDAATVTRHGATDVGGDVFRFASCTAAVAFGQDVAAGTGGGGGPGVVVHVGECIERGDALTGAPVAEARRAAERVERGEVLVTAPTRLLGITASTEATAAIDGLDGPLELFRVGNPLPSRTTPSSDIGHQLTRNGEVWTARFDGDVARLRDTKGMHDLAQLLAAPGRELHVIDLVGVANSATRGTGPALDEQARAAFAARLRDLEAEADEARAHADIARAEKAEEERDALVAELSAAYGLAGKARPQGDDVERARKAVARRVKDAIVRVEAVHPKLGRHLRSSIRTGAWCTYEPAERVNWHVSF